KGRHFEIYLEKEEGLFRNDVLFNITEEFCRKIGFSKLEVFYYIYGLLNSQDYINKYQNDLIKDIPRVPKVKSAENFIHIGEKLMDLHLNYEKTPLYKGASVE